jgi:hypothetical protein
MAYSPPQPPEDKWATLAIGFVGGLIGLAIFIPGSWVLWALLQ